MASKIVPKPRFLISTGFKKWCYNLTGFNKYGLMHDDVLQETPEVTEAIRRLPQDLQDARIFRIVRAMQLSCQKTILPKEQWTKYEEDVRYLRPYLEEVRREIAEKEKWDGE
ncbi:cytochrome b-c1 complex subunit 7-like [Microplitis demolitor]|uniref:cytochrome b-c1 complex subunit 7-like n=1 Tax=Microplitis demolitor TaxID=69319 RepID=UPI0004CD4A3E|nr:cytochrome b-c1 complex subunit 7-like [Microplitis demolitor]